MTSAILVVLLALALLLFTIRTARGRNRQALDNPVNHLRPMDVEAFRNLLDPAEEEFLRSRLLPAEFRKIQRERLGAAGEYILGAARNARIMLLIAESARQSGDLATAESAQRLIDEATQLRLYAFRMMPRLYLAMLFPSRRISPIRVAESYEQMTQRVVSLGLQYPTHGVSGAL
jgi:hypothetical protein